MTTEITIITDEDAGTFTLGPAYARAICQPAEGNILWPIPAAKQLFEVAERQLNWWDTVNYGKIRDEVTKDRLVRLACTETRILDQIVTEVFRFVDTTADEVEDFLNS